MRLAAVVSAWIAIAICGLAAAQAGEQTAPRPGAGVVAPTVRKDVKPVYPPQALTERNQGVVRLECVVKADGTVGAVRVVEGIAPELNDAAVAALKQWTFNPGTKDGVAVAVTVQAEMSFTLRDAGPLLGSPEVYQVGNGVSPPTVLKEAKPDYTAEAREARIQGTIRMDCVVRVDGTVGDVRVTRTLDPGLDAVAVKTLRLWRFRPGRKDGKDVPVQVTIEMSFTLR